MLAPCALYNSATITNSSPAPSVRGPFSRQNQSKMPGPVVGRYAWSAIEDTRSTIPPDLDDHFGLGCHMGKRVFDQVTQRILDCGGVSQFASRIRARAAGGDAAALRSFLAEPHRSAGPRRSARLLSRRDRDGPQARAAQRLDYGRPQLFAPRRRGQADPAPLWQRSRARFIRALNLPARPEPYLQRLEAGLTAGLASLAEAVAAGTVVVEDDQLRLPRPKPAPRNPRVDQWSARAAANATSTT